MQREHIIRAFYTEGIGHRDGGWSTIAAFTPGVQDAIRDTYVKLYNQLRSAYGEQVERNELADLARHAALIGVAETIATERYGKESIKKDTQLRELHEVARRAREEAQITRRGGEHDFDALERDTKGVYARELARQHAAVKQALLKELPEHVDNEEIHSIAGDIARHRTQSAYVDYMKRNVASA